MMPLCVCVCTQSPVLLSNSAPADFHACSFTQGKYGGEGHEE